MTISPTPPILNIYQRIHNVMKEVTTIKKEDKKINGQYTFVSHDEVTRVMHDAFVKHGIVMIPNVVDFVENSYTDTAMKWDDKLNRKTEQTVLICKTSVKIDISFINIDDPSDKICVQFPGMGIDNQDKGIGKAISYAVKYALLKTFCLETSDDVEKDSISYKPSPKKTEEVSPLQIDHLKTLTSEERLTDFMKRSNLKSLYDMTLLQYNNIMNTLKIEESGSSIDPHQKVWAKK